MLVVVYYNNPGSNLFPSFSLSADLSLRGKQTSAHTTTVTHTAAAAFFPVRHYCLHGRRLHTRRLHTRRLSTRTGGRPLTLTARGGDRLTQTSPEIFHRRRRDPDTVHQKRAGPGIFHRPRQDLDILYRKRQDPGIFPRPRQDPDIPHGPRAAPDISHRSGRGGRRPACRRTDGEILLLLRPSLITPHAGPTSPTATTDERSGPLPE